MTGTGAEFTELLVAVIMSTGCHSGPFFTQQEPPSLAFLARYLP